MEEERLYKAHVMVLPFHGQGHMNPMLQFSKRLLFKGLKVTLLTILSTTKTMGAEAGSITLESIYDDSIEGGLAGPEGFKGFVERFKASILRTLPELINKHKSSKYPVKCLVYDANLPWALDLAKKYGLFGAAFFTQSCAAIASYYPIQKEILGTPLPEPPVSVPRLTTDALPNLPSFGSDSGQIPPIVKVILDQFSNIDKSDWVLFNSFDKLEDEVMKWMASLWPVKTIGPTIPSIYLDKRVEGDTDYGFNLFQPKSNICKEWLNTKENGSVIYISFGSAAALSAEQTEEMALALKQNNHNFLWVVRASENNKLPQNFTEETSDKGLVVTWCSQLEVLSHKAVGCFITHCGWNSTMEGISLGVPMVVMPQFLDQYTNAQFVEEVWGTGVRPKLGEKGIAMRDEINRCISKVMERDIGKDIRSNAYRWKEWSKEAVDEGGSSDKNIDEIVGKLLSS